MFHWIVVISSSFKVRDIVVSFILDQSTVSASFTPRHPVDFLELWRPEDILWNGKKTTRFARKDVECWKFSREVTLRYLQVSYFDLPLNKRTYKISHEHVFQEHFLANVQYVVLSVILTATLNL